MYLDAEFSPKECDLKISEKVQLADASCQKDKKMLSTELSIEKSKFEKILSYKENRIKFLEKRWTTTPWYQSGELWFSVGIVSGILITIASGYALSQIPQAR